MRKILSDLPVVALRETVILPGMVMHFDIGRKMSIRAVEQAMLRDQHLFAVAQKDPAIETPDAEDLFSTGTLVSIRQVIKLPKGLIRVLAEGVERAQLVQITEVEPCMKADIVPLEDDDFLSVESDEIEAMSRTLKDLFHEYCQVSMKITPELAGQILATTDLKSLIDQIIIQVPESWQQAQRFLEAVDPDERYDILTVFLAEEINVLEIGAEIQERVKARIDQNQREFFLREQLKVIREELGDDTTLDQLDEYREKTAELNASEEVKEKLNKEINRLAGIGTHNPTEGGVIRGYIETLLNLPWDNVSQDNTNLKYARKVLEDDHYGLEQIKERVLEYLAVRIVKQKGDSPILCLVGPPGTGKTSIAKSIAGALNKEYIRICLGGIRDEAEIRGHRRTYIGAMPGRLAKGLSQAKVKNPLILLDEIDKVSSDHKGDTSSALLEVLDPEQNVHFSDHYVELPIDLSEVLFIATANDASAIPRPLLDRMEMIEVSGYTENEKEHIAIEHLIPKQFRANGIKRTELTITKRAVAAIIDGYTKEAGVRQLERLIGRICRKAALKLQEEELTKITVTPKNLEDFLGKQKYHINKANKQPQIGIVRGLAWTSVGGVTMQIEANIMPGKGELILTGQLGDVMQESAKAGITYVRSVAGKYGIAEDYFMKNDLHLHIPEGAVPKDGPSAGISMASAILSAAAGIPVKADVAMTGEITLRGRVLPIGGLKEKLLAAQKAGMKKVLIPEQNRPDLEEIDSEIKDGLSIVFVENMDQVVAECFAK